jgi:hypothetical protein
MENPYQSPPPSKAAWWIGAVLSALPVLMCLMGIVMLLTNPDELRKGMAEQGYPENVAVPLVIVQLVCTLLYIFPQTAMLGAILLTGYLGGAVATHVRASEWSLVPLPILVGVLVWLGLYLRDARIRALVPWRVNSNIDFGTL